MRFTIRDFGNDTQCASIAELKEALATKYADNSVSIQYKRPSGMVNVKFVDVSKCGQVVTDSYGEEGLFDYDGLDAEAA